MDDLADFLRTRRSRVLPETVGIPADSRRRVSGLRREEVAHLAGVSVDYYVRLEQGRARQPSAQVLDALARALGLDEVERGHLHRLAHRPAQAPRRPSTARLRPELLRVLDLVADAPAFLIDHRLTVLGANRLTDLLYGRRAEGLNLARHIFLTEEGHALFADWEACTLDTVGHLRLSAGRHPDDPELASLIGELAMRSERFRRLWARADVRTRTHGAKAYNHAAVGRLELHQENFALPDTTGTELIVQSAAPGTTAHDNLRLLASLGAPEAPSPTGPRPQPRGTG
ncbi:helix-turn-helix domain-containing protein [Streptomyces sp. NPDC001691]|uniref:helix-turn-helix domain-containing protein n=1 Tax=unclassified Streptomyces TaxID=2593676 RepID=UPI000DE8C008|nr:helix-turn-helix transcriptional regulator [Streptomyces sp. SDr-06]RCH67774.1 XRE family transcriptional regulator [Streptomyces sp. SDr-06]